MTGVAGGHVLLKAFTGFPSRDSIKACRNHAGGATTPENETFRDTLSVIFRDNHNATQSAR
jgi:hypothetical protein